MLALGISASLLLFSIVWDAVDEVARLRFERQASDARRVIDVRIHSYAGILYGVKALFETQGSIGRDQFHRFVQSLDLKNRYPSLESVNYMTYVPAAAKERFVESVRRDTSLDPRGYPDFSIKPPGERPEYFVLVYLEPMAGFEFAFGRDLGANPAASDPQGVAAAVRLTRDSGQLTASGLPLRMKSAGKEYVGLAMRLGVYRSDMPAGTADERRAAFLGSVGAGFNVNDLMKGVLDETTSRYMRFKLYDAGSATDSSAARLGQRRLLFNSNELTQDSRGEMGAKDKGAMFSRILPMEVGGRIWEIHFSARKDEVIGPVDALFPWVVLLGGIFSSLLLCGVMFSLASSRSRAVEIATDMTKHLRESEASLAEAQRMAHLGNWSLEPPSGAMTWSAETYRIFGLDPGSTQYVFSDFLQRVHDEDRTAVRDAVLGAIDAEQNRDIEHRVRLPDGTVRWVHTIVQATSRGAGAPVPATMRDITEQKRIEDALRASAEQLTALSHRLVEVQEAERRRLARELHDRVGQNLTALSINLDILRTSLSAESLAQHAARLTDSSALLESTVDSIENVMAELRPPMLDDYGLLSALHWYAKEFSGRTGIEVTVVGGDVAERPSSETEITLFRIAQEALNNVAKHARAKHVKIGLDHSNGHCAMTVTDDGIGFESAQRSKTKHRQGLGMMSMRERAQAVGGRFEVRRMRAGGTRISIRIP